jgi:hypothetical protein
LLRITVRDPDRRWDRSDWAKTSDLITSGGAVVLAAYVDEKSIDLFVEPDGDGSSAEVVRRATRAFGVDEIEATEVESLAVRRSDAWDFTHADPLLANPHRARITRMWTGRDGRSLRVEINHRAGEALHSTEVDESCDCVRVAAIVGEPAPMARPFSWRTGASFVTVPLRDPLGTRRLTARQPRSRDAERADVS